MLSNIPSNLFNTRLNIELVELTIVVIDIVFELRSKQPKRSFRCFMVQGETLYS